MAQPSKQKSNKLLVGALVATSAASLIFGTRYYRALDEMSQLRAMPNAPYQPRDAIEDRIQDAYNTVAAKAEQVMPAVKRDYRKIAGYGGAGLLAGLALAYFAKRRKNKVTT